MLLNIILREIHQHILSLRLHLSLILVFVLFGLGAVAFIKSHNADMENYKQVYADYLGLEKGWAEDDIGNYMNEVRSLSLAPRTDGFITDARERVMPYQFWYTGYDVHGFDVPNWASNELIRSFAELSWMYIVSIVLSFIVLLLSYDLVSGDREGGTLALTVSNPVPRGVLITGKYLSVILVSMLVLLPGIVLSLIIMLLSRVVVFKGMLLAEIAGFLVGAAIFAACMAALGMLSSVLVSRSNVSLLICLCIWLGSVVVVPNSAVYFSGKLFPIESSRSNTERRERAIQEVNDRQQDYFDENRDKRRTDQELYRASASYAFERLNAEKSIKDEWNNSLVSQFQDSRMLAAASPVSLFEQLSEAVVGGGVVRLRKSWQDIQIYQTQLLEWFKGVDADDPESLHIPNPRHSSSVTGKGVDFESVPQFTERRASFAERLAAARLSLALLVLYTALAFALSFVLFLRYDVR